MCGIAGFYFHDPSNCPLTKISKEKLVNELLLGIEHRGTDATGVAAVTPTGELHIEKADLEASRFNWWRSELPSDVRSVLLHTRYATKGTPMNLDNNHPIRYNNVVAIHNGHINNDDEIFLKEGLERNAEVDSECIAALFDKHGIEKAQIALGKLDGNYAVAVADLRSPETLVLAKGWNSPLFYYEATEGLIWASTQKTIVDAANKALGLNIQNRDLRELYFGYLLLVENGEVEKYKFDVYEKPRSTSTYTYLNNNDYYSNKDEESKASEDSRTLFERWNDQAWGRNWFGGKKKKKEETKEDKDIGIPRDLITTDEDHIKFWEKEPHEMAYRVTSGEHTFLFKACDGCEYAFQTTMLNLTTEGYIFCDSCLRDFDEIPKDNPAVVHEVVIDLVAEKFSTKPEFVNWLLFEAEDEEINQGDLVNLYIQLNDEYDIAHAELTGENFGAAEHIAEIATEALEDEDEELCGVEVFADSDFLASYPAIPTV